MATYYTFGGFRMSINQETESRYYCAGRYCTMREQCHRHTSSTGVNRAPFEDYDLLALRTPTKPCQHYIDRDNVNQSWPQSATGVNS